MIDNLIFNTPSQPSDQVAHRFVLHVQAPSNDLVALMHTKRIELVKQLPQLHYVGIVCCKRTSFTQVNAAPVAYRLRRFIRLRFSHGHILASQLLFHVNSVDRKLGQRIDAEDLYFWKRSNKAVSNG